MAARLLAASAVPLTGLVVVTGRQSTLGPSALRVAVVVAVVWVVAEVTRWAVVARRQTASSPETVAVDDAIRATTVHAVSGSAVAVMGMALGGLLSNSAGDAQNWGWLYGSLGLLLSAGSIGVWIGYGMGLLSVVRRDGRGGTSDYDVQTSRVEAGLS